jgi:hypothetical protein
MVGHSLEKMHRCAAGSACRPRQGEDALVARYELAAACEAYMSLMSPHKAESVQCGGGALRTGEVLFDDRL